MKIILLIFAAIQVTTLQGLPTTCEDRIINRFVVMMPSPNIQGKWVFFPWPVHKTVILNDLKGGKEDLVVKNEYEKEDFWSKMDGKWMKEIRDFIMSKYKLSSSKLFHANFGSGAETNPERSEFLSKKDGDWIQEIKEYFKNKYFFPLALIGKGLKEKGKTDDYWSKMDGKWAQEIGDYFRDKFSSSQESEKSSEEDKTNTSANTSVEGKQFEEIMEELPLEINESSETPRPEKEAPKNSEGKDNSSSEEDMPAEIKEKLKETGLSQPEEESSLVDKGKSSSYKEDGSMSFDITKQFAESSTTGNYKPKKMKLKIKEKIFTFPQEYPVAPSKSGKSQSSEESEENLKESNEKPGKGDIEKLSGTLRNEDEELLDDASVVNLEGKNDLESEALVLPQNVSESLNGEKSSEESGGSEFEHNFPGCGKFKKLFKKYKIPYGLAKKFQEDQASKRPIKPMKRFTSV